jgi:SHS family lactate transporter-like MFS transporter
MADEKVSGTVEHNNGADLLHESQHPEKVSVAKYAATRITTLKPPMHKAPNPFRLLAMLNGKQWLFFFVGFLAWVRDALNVLFTELTLS